MSYIQDDEQLIKSCIKYIDEDKIVDFLNSIEFEFDDYDDIYMILQTSNSKCIEFCIDDNCTSTARLYDTIDTINDLIEDNVISNTAIKIIKNKLLKQTNPDVIYKILKSNLVTWENDHYNPFISGFFDGENGNVSQESILNQDEVNVLFSIYAKSEHWLELVNINYVYAENEDSLAEHIDDELESGGYHSIQYIIERVIDEEYVKDYFNGNIPDKVNTNILVDILIKYDIYRYL